MSADALRTAAELMRHRAEGARSFWPSDDHDGMDEAPWMDTEWWNSVGLSSLAGDHAAAWHPAVALAVADWLDAQAERVEIGFSGKVYEQALAAAHAYLGEHVAPAVERIVTDRVARARAEALHEAADELARKGHRSAVTRLREMASRELRPPHKDGCHVRTCAEPDCVIVCRCREDQ